MNNKELLNLSKQIKALADAGLVFKNSEYDAERYEQLQEIALEMQALLTEQEVEVFKNFYLPKEDYPTPNVDVRAFILNEKKEILFVKEQVDGKWTLPGGWADIGLSPKENVIKELEEETGYIVEVKRLLAVFDKKMHAHPPQPHYVYKMCFLCEIVSQESKPNFDIAGIDWFSLKALPELSTDRILKNQIDILLEHLDASKPVYFD